MTGVFLPLFFNNVHFAEWIPFSGKKIPPARKEAGGKTAICNLNPAKSYTIPCASMAWATFIKPAMLAPFT